MTGCGVRRNRASRGSSVRYELGIFSTARRDALVAAGHFVHVFVDRANRAPTPIPERMRDALERLRRA